MAGCSGPASWRLGDSGFTGATPHHITREMNVGVLISSAGWHQLSLAECSVPFCPGCKPWGWLSCLAESQRALGACAGPARCRPCSALPRAESPSLSREEAATLLPWAQPLLALTAKAT